MEATLRLEDVRHEQDGSAQHLREQANSAVWGGPLYNRPAETATWDGWRPRSDYTPKRSWVTLDKSWAQALGVQRDGGVYRIPRRELARRLAEFNGAAQEQSATGQAEAACLDWSASDDAAVAKLLAEAHRRGVAYGERRWSTRANLAP